MTDKTDEWRSVLLQTRERSLRRADAIEADLDQAHADLTFTQNWVNNLEAAHATALRDVAAVDEILAMLDIEVIDEVVDQ